MPALDVAEHLEAAIATDDPWQLSSNVFELRRYAIMLDMMTAHQPAPGSRFKNILEIGCAAGVFTEMLHRHGDAMHVIDVMPAFIERAAARLKHANNITWEVASVMDAFAPGKTFDLIIAAEVMCYIPDAPTLRRTVERLASMLAPGGLLIFGGAIDAVVKRWGMPGVGAESTMAEWERVLRETNRAACKGAYWGEDTRIVGYTRDADGALPGASFRTPEQFIVPAEAGASIPATGVLALAAHIGDEVLGCGGALALHAGLHPSAPRVPVRVVAAIDGAPNAETSDLTALTNGARAAAKALGYAPPVQWHFQPRRLAIGEALVARILAAMEGADLVYAPSLDEPDPDRRILALAAAEAVRRRPGARLAFYEIGAPLRPNLLLDISPVADVKRAAVAGLSTGPRAQRHADQIAALNRYRTFPLGNGIAAAESFLMLPSQTLNADPLALHRPETERHLAESHFAQQELMKVSRRLREREQELDALYRSTSWKLTAPVRKLRRLFGRG